ncbi:hypothetical protein NQZ68_011450 [Dissostichus eleginoides]|nr:hypothetical protein NQZ68_011450 [Dissostichus eleginoides]
MLQNLLLSVTCSAPAQTPTQTNTQLAPSTLNCPAQVPVEERVTNIKTFSLFTSQPVLEE